MDAFTIGSWPVDSRVTLCRVAWDQQYRDVVRFADETERTTYFTSLKSDSINIEKMTYLRFGEPIRINIPFNACYNYNYLIVENPKLPVPGETEPPKLFYFITGVAMVAPNTSALTLQLDVFQTYLFDFELGQCFIERSHLPMKTMSEYVTWDESENPSFSWATARRYLTVPEGLDIGNEYVIAAHSYKDLTVYMNPEGSSQLFSSGWATIIMSTTNLEASWGDETSPNLETATGQTYDGLIGGCNCYMILGDLSELMDALSKAPWVASGIISITAMPLGFFSTAINNNTMEAVSFNGGAMANFAFKLPNTDDDFEGTFADRYPIIETILNSFGTNIRNVYRHFLKLFTFPYMTIEISARNGASLCLKPELLNSNTLELRTLSCAVPGNIRVCFYPYRYGAGTYSRPYEYSFATLDTDRGDIQGVVDGGFNVDTAIWFDNFPQLSFVNDNYLMYLAGTTHTREYQYNSAGWQQAKSNMSADLMQSNFYTSANAQLANQRISNIAGAAGIGLNLIGGAASGGYAGLGGSVLGGIGSGIGMYAQNLQLENSLGAQGDITNANAQLARDFAQGDYENTIAGINATVQDMSLTQPSIVGANGGNGFNVSNGLIGYDIRYKTPDNKHIFMLAKYWGRYGYAVHEFTKPPTDLKCMRYFTYWKMKDVHITCAKADEGAKDVLRGIFERGVTVWNRPDDIGNVDPLDNWEVA